MSKPLDATGIVLTDAPQLGKHDYAEPGDKGNAGGLVKGRILPVPPNRAERRRNGPEPIRWIQTSANSHATAFGPWRIDVTELPSLSALDPPQYEFSITPVEEKLGSDIPTLEMAKTVAVRFLALAMKKGMDSLIEHGVIGIKEKSK